MTESPLTELEYIADVEAELARAELIRQADAGAGKSPAIPAAPAPRDWILASPKYNFEA